MNRRQFLKGVTIVPAIPLLAVAVNHLWQESLGVELQQRAAIKQVCGVPVGRLGTRTSTATEVMAKLKERRSPPK